MMAETREGALEMPAQRRFGMDHLHYPWRPLPKRPPLRWPEGDRVALCVVVNLEHMEWMPSEGSYWRREPVRGLRQPGFSGLHAKVPSGVRASGGDLSGAGRAGRCGDSANHRHGLDDSAELSVSGGALHGAGRGDYGPRGFGDADDYGEDGGIGGAGVYRPVPGGDEGGDGNDAPRGGWGRSSANRRGRRGCWRRRGWSMFATGRTTSSLTR